MKTNLSAIMMALGVAALLAAPAAAKTKYVSHAYGGHYAAPYSEGDRYSPTYPDYGAGGDFQSGGSR